MITEALGLWGCVGLEALLGGKGVERILEFGWHLDDQT